VNDAPTFDDLLEKVMQAAQDAGVSPRSFQGVTMGRGKIYVVQNAHSSLAEFEATVLHELYGHAGPRTLFGPEITRRLNRIYSAIGNVSVYLKLKSMYMINPSTPMLEIPSPVFPDA
jgi:hypothetical protein